jgi:hypothetical protein
MLQNELTLGKCLLVVAYVWSTIHVFLKRDKNKAA